MIRPFTGRHMAFIMIGFFGVVFAVNFTMARLAIGSFGGTVVANSYVASQEFNGWLKDAAAQKALGWTTKVTLDADRHIEIHVTTPSGEDAIHASGAASHPLGRATDIPLSFLTVAPGRLRAIEALPAGRWTLHATIERKGHHIRLMETIQ